MRADRLLSMLMLLQTRGRMTAHQLSKELEVSERTVYRDIIALSSAGIPVYTESGPGGGISLVESYQTDLTGLSPQEAQALSMLNIPEPLVHLGVGNDLKTALLKLSAAIPASIREEQVHARYRIHLDASWWFQSEEPTPYLQTLQQAVWQDRLVQIKFRNDFNVISQQEIKPYGLVAKTSIWYLVFSWKERVRALRVSRIISATMLSQSFERPLNFDLAAFWHQWCEDYENSRPRYEVTALVMPGLVERLPRLLQENQPDILMSPPDMQREGWKIVNLTFESLEIARTRILGLGGAIEVLEPQALRESISDYALQIQALYKGE